MSESIEHRLSPRAIPIFALTAVREIVPLLIVALLTGRLDLDEMGFWIFGGVAALLLGAFNWLTTRFAFESDRLSLRRGLFFKEHRQLPYARVQNLSWTTTVVHRLLGLTHVRVESASGAGTEIDLNGMTVDQAEELRRRWQSQRGTAAHETDATPAPLLQLRLGELVKLGLVDNRGLILVTTLFAFLVQIGDNVLKLMIEYARDTALPWLAAHSPNGAQPDSWPLYVVLLVAAVVLVRLLSVVLAILNFYGFTLHRDGSELKVVQGLLTRKNLSVRIPRVQSIRIKQSLLHRPFRRAAVHISTAAGVAVNKTDSLLKHLVPIGRPADIAKLLPRIFDALDWRTLRWRQLAPQALAYLALKSLLFFVPASLVAMSLSPALGMVVVAIGIIRLLLHWRYCENSRYHVSQISVALAARGISREMTIIARRRIQSVTLRQGPLRRRFDLATVEVDLAGSGLPFGFAVPLLPLAEARALAEALSNLPEEHALPPAIPV